MSSNRRLQGEVDRTLKRISEGLDVFDETWEKLKNANNPSQKDKWEADLKKEIKKLQRLREQVKTWATSSSEIRDKAPLLKGRRDVETRMERFKELEREMKTKAYSREGLSKSSKLSEEEQAAEDCKAWLSDRIDEIKEQQEKSEADVEALSSTEKKKKKNADKIKMLEERIGVYLWHVEKLELVIRAIENQVVDINDVNEIKEDIEYFIESNLEPDFYNDMELYDPLELEDKMAQAIVPTVPVVLPTVATKKKGSKKGDADDESVDSTTKKKKKKKEKEKDQVDTLLEQQKQRQAILAQQTAAQKAKKEAMQQQRERLAELERQQAQQQQTQPPTQQQTSPSESAAEDAAVSPHLAANGAVDPTPGEAAGVSAPPPPNQQQVVPPSAPPQQQTPPGTLDEQQQQTPLQQQPKEQLAELQHPPQQLAGAPPKDDTQLAQASEAPQQQQQQPPQQVAPPGGQGQPGAPPSGAAQAQPPVLDTAAPPTPRVPRPQVQLPALDARQRMSLLDSSLLHCPQPADSDRPKVYYPKQPIATPGSFPANPPGVLDSPAIFQHFEPDTLFLIFFHQQGTYQQYLAARELKRKSWRFHKKYRTWFQRHQDPTTTDNEYEIGTYVYFDYESGWCQRIKTDFRFDYQFLE